MKILTLASLFIFFYSAEIKAQQNGKKFFGFSLGAGAAVKRNIRFDNTYDRSDKPTNINYFPFATIKIGPLRLSGRGIEASTWFAAPFIRPFVLLTRSGDRYYGPEMDRRKDSWFLGGGINILFLRLSFLKDVQSRSHGSLYSASLGHRIMIDKWFLRPSLTMTYNNQKYNNYYYGVRPHEVSLERPEYTAHGAFSYTLSLLTNYSITDHWKVFSTVSHSILGSVVRNSPTTRTDRVNSFFLALFYQF
ncbi:MipA/OmpV family protein [Halobacteriovorax sp. GB3]|uniref:MipA/OmpV family protein n=1 Tax=Halobacteriovorax sp. GB3 TaxID=2719615 RepID=UPI00235DF399|nr:MipA/OmpV family protein [Halobacteriovorax sp. GB3]MDD0853435.1 MipA/OmpV family protein [Halobacteriovorax sp. GB3]